jgi:hypothetical protein
MKILKAVPDVLVYIETDDPDYPDFLRFSPNSWVQRMGESWEPVYDDQECEEAYQEHLRANPA